MVFKESRETSQKEPSVSFRLKKEGRVPDRREWNKQWRLRNKERIVKGNRKYRKSHKKQIKTYNREYAKKNKDWILQKQRQRFLRSTKSSGFKLNKRLWLGFCELCGKRYGGKRAKLDYHHWDDSNLNKGMWLCFKCHLGATAIEKGFSIKKYLRLKTLIEKQFQKKRRA